MAQAVEVFRYFNALLGLAVFFLLFFRGRALWPTYDQVRRISYVGLIVYIFATAGSSAQALILHSPPSVWTFLFTVANLITLCAHIKYLLLVRKNQQYDVR